MFFYFFVAQYYGFLIIVTTNILVLWSDQFDAHGWRFKKKNYK